MNKLPLLALVACASCTTLHSPTVDTSVSYTSQYWFRGAVQNDNGALQADVNVALQNENDDTVGFAAWGNVDASNDTGDAPFPDNNGGDLTEVDLITYYGTHFGETYVEFGLVSYHFPNAVGSSTTEVYGSTGWDLGVANLDVVLFYDFDALDDYYANVGLSRSLEVDERMWVDLGLNLGFIGEDQAAAYFGAQESGLSDLNLGATLNYVVNDNCTAFLGATSTSIPNSDLEDAVKTSGYNDGDLWFNFGFGWSY